MAVLTPDDFPAVTEFFDFLSKTMNTYVNDTSTDIITAITPAASYCGIIVITIYGIMLMRGSIQAPLVDATYKALRFMIILGIALNAGIYQSVVRDFCLEAPSAMASAITGTPMTSGAGVAIATPITEFLVASYNLGDRIFSEADTFDFGSYLLGAIVYLIGC